MACWGDKTIRVGVPDGEFVAVSASLHTALRGPTCALRSDGEVSCWRVTSFELLRPLPVPDGAFSAVAAGNSHACGIRLDASITCWGYLDCGPTNLPVLSPTPQQSNTPLPVVPARGSVEDVSYALVTTPAPCNNDGGSLEPPDGRFTAVTAGGHYSCGLEETGTIRCWGGWYDSRTFEPSGQFRSVAVGADHTCAVRTDNTIRCWSLGSSSRAFDPPGQFRSVAVGAYHTCAVRTDNTIRCWGNHGEGQTKAPAGEFISVTAGYTHSCGLRPNGTVECWGGTYGDNAEPPSSQFTDLSAGDRHACGVGTDGTLECWNLLKSKLADVPDNVPWTTRA